MVHSLLTCLVSVLVVTQRVEGAEVDCASLKCPQHQAFRGSFTNATYFFDPDYHIWRPNMEKGFTDLMHETDPGLASSVTWTFCDPADESAANCKCTNRGDPDGTRVTHSLTVWGQPLGGPPATADDVGAVLPGIRYCCSVGPDDGSTRGSCVDHQCSRDPTGPACQTDEDCGTCNMVLTRDDEEPDVAKSPYPAFDPDCKFIMGSKKMRLNYLSWRQSTDDQITSPLGIYVENSNDPGKYPSGSSPADNSDLAYDSLLLEVDEESEWPYAQCNGNSDEKNVFRHMSTLSSTTCRKCTGASDCTDNLRINCLNARLKKVPIKQQTWPFLLVSFGGGFLFLASWGFLFWSVRDPVHSEAVPSDADPTPNHARNASAASPYVNHRSKNQRRCDRCGSTVDESNAKFCAVCGAPSTEFLVYKRNGLWERDIKKQNPNPNRQSNGANRK